MLTPEQITEAVETLQPIIDDLNAWITADLMQRVMARIGRGELYLTASDDWQLQVYQEAGGHLEAVQKEIAKWTKVSDVEVKRIFEDAGIKALANDSSFFVQRGYEALSLAQTEGMLRLLEDTYQQTGGTIRNFTRTTAHASQKKLIDVLDTAHFKVTSGAASYTQAVQEAVADVVNSQTQVIYPTGHVDTVETAVLRAVRTGVAQASGRLALQAMAIHEWDVVQVSAHLGARYGDGGENPGNHAWWQGRLYSRSGTTRGLPPFVESTGYGTGEGLCGWNCRHSFGPGDVDHNPYYDFDTAENQRAYDLSQRQRLLERRIRHTKAKLVGLRQAIDGVEDPELKAILETQYRRTADLLDKQNYAYNNYCKTNGLKRLPERLQIAQWTREDARRAIIVAPWKPIPRRYISSKPVLSDVTDEYRAIETSQNKNAGKVIYSPGYAKRIHVKEIERAEWIAKTFGEDVTLIPETKERKKKTPDYQWREKMWELKTISSLNSADKNLQKALKQIAENPGGVILDCGAKDIPFEELRSTIKRRMDRRGGTESVDIMIVSDGLLVSVFRHRKKER